MRAASPYRRKGPRFLLMYPPLQFGPNDSVKPDGSLSLPYVAGALRDAGFEVKILDACVGSDKDDLKDTFFNPVELPNGLMRVGMSRERISNEILDYDVVGISSIFTVQTSMVLDLVRLIKSVDPSKFVIAGGVNARYLAGRFFDSGVDVICLSEAEKTVVQIADTVRSGSRDFSAIPGIALKDRDGNIAFNNARDVVNNLDELPLPAWDLLPIERYWDISRPHGGDFPADMRIQYASLMTSRGCPFSCSYCHISKETKGAPSGEIGNLRLKSLERVMEEIHTLKGLGAKYVFLEDDSLLAKKDRAVQIFRALKGEGLKLVNLNGVNIVHMVRNEGGGRLVTDRGLLEAMAESGFEKLSLPFESGSQRIIDKYASKKWQVGKLDTVALIHDLLDLGIMGLGNYTIGYPDETFEEMMETIMMAKRHVEEGLAAAHFFVIVPFPGTTLFDMSIREGYLSADFDPDDMRWTRSIFRNTPVSPDALEYIRTIAWNLTNRSDFLRNKQAAGFEALASVSAN